MERSILHDRLHGTTFSEDTIPHYRRSFDDEFVRPDGRANVIRSRRVGIALPFSVVTVSDAVVAFWMNPGLPDLAQRTWWFIRDQLLDIAGGRAEVGMRGWDTLDPGNYTLNNPGYTLAKLVLAAREMGDEEAADAVQAKLEERPR